MLFRILWFFISWSITIVGSLGSDIVRRRDDDIRVSSKGDMLRRLLGGNQGWPNSVRTFDNFSFRPGSYDVNLAMGVSGIHYQRYPGGSSSNCWRVREAEWVIEAGSGLPVGTDACLDNAAKARDLSKAERVLGYNPVALDRFLHAFDSTSVIWAANVYSLNASDVLVEAEHWTDAWENADVSGARVELGSEFYWGKFTGPNKRFANATEYLEWVAPVAQTLVENDNEVLLGVVMEPTELCGLPKWPNVSVSDISWLEQVERFRPRWFNALILHEYETDPSTLWLVAPSDVDSIREAIAALPDALIQNAVAAIANRFPNSTTKLWITESGMNFAGWNKNPGRNGAPGLCEGVKLHRQPACSWTLQWNVSQNPNVRDGFLQGLNTLSRVLASAAAAPVVDATILHAPMSHFASPAGYLTWFDSNGSCWVTAHTQLYKHLSHVVEIQGLDGTISRGQYRFVTQDILPFPVAGRNLPCLQELLVKRNGTDGDVASITLFVTNRCSREASANLSLPVLSDDDRRIWIPVERIQYRHTDLNDAAGLWPLAPCSDDMVYEVPWKRGPLLSKYLYPGEPRMPCEAGPPVLVAMPAFSVSVWTWNGSTSADSRCPGTGSSDDDRTRTLLLATIVLPSIILVIVICAVSYSSRFKLRELSFCSSIFGGGDVDTSAAPESFDRDPTYEYLGLSDL